MQLTLKTLGTLEASSEDAEGTVRVLARGKPAAMLAYLACSPGHKASREHLASLLWGDVESDAARQNLRQTLWYLKKKLGDGVLDGTSEIVGLAAAFTCDRDDFLQAAQRADFAAAVQQHRGPFIPDFAAPGASEFEQWCELERRRITVTFLRCADALARQWLSEGKFRDAQELAARARDVEPLDQGAWRLLLEALVAGSDGLGAASEAEHFEAFLAREEAEPEAASLAVIRMARRLPSAPTTSGTAPSPSIAAELVGRESEFSHVLSSWEQVRSGAPRVMVITAAAGLGKSRLLRDVQARLRASRSRCVLVRANPGDRHLSGGFAAEVASQLAALAGAAAISTGSAGVLVALAPALASVYSSATPDRSDGEEAVRRRALAIVDLAHAVSDEHPVAVLLDDLHWADDHSARVLAAALSRLEHARLLVLIARRPAADPRGLLATFDRLELPPLDLSAVTAFVSHVAELPPVPWAELLPQQLLLATGGSPLLLVESLHDAMEQRLLTVSTAGLWECGDPERITQTLRDGSAVRQRVLRLAPCARRVLLVLAVVGRPVEIDEAIAMTGGEWESAQEHVDALERSGFVVRSGMQLTVAHDEIADAAVAAATDAERRDVQTAIANRLLAHGDDEHALRRAAEHALQAGNDALMLHAWRLFLDLRRRAADQRATRTLAVDLLGMDSASPRVDQLVSATPMLKRRRTRWMAAAGVVLAAVLGAAPAMLHRPPRQLTSDFAWWVVDSASGAGHLVGVRLKHDEKWTAGEPIEAVALDSTDFPLRSRDMDGVLYRSPNGKEWWAHAVVPGLGDEGIFIDSVGVRHLPLRSPYDDAITSISPDGRQFVGSTARFDTLTDHMALVTAPLRGGPLRRLTGSAEYQRAPAWRPDGTQIAFVRHYYTTPSADRICLVDVDGSNERCLASELSGTQELIGWVDERRMLFRKNDGSSMITLDESSGSVTAINAVRGTVAWAQGEIQACTCRLSDDGDPSAYLVPTANLSSARPVMYHGRPLRGALRYAAPIAATGEWLDTLRLRLPAGGLAVDNVHRLQVDGRRANGAPAWLHDLRWTSRDTSVATVGADGRLRPRRLGSVWIVVSAGGWRTDSALAHIVPPSSRTVLHERWDVDWQTRWRPFGTPMGMVVQTDRGRALLPNGDGSYPSGAYSPVLIAATTGAGVEADLSMTITASQWQTLSIVLMQQEVLGPLNRWDHRTGKAASSAPRPCEVHFPGDEGALGRDDLTLGAVSHQVSRRMPPSLYSGSWHRVRMQMLPDGRCAVAIDGHPFAIVSAGAPVSTSRVFVHLEGDDRFGGRLVVGPLDAWSGVRGGVDWTELDEAPTKKKP